MTIVQIGGPRRPLAIWSSTWKIFMETAAVNAREAYDLESQSTRGVWPLQHQAAVLGGIMMACSGLEAFVNELFLGALDKAPRKLVGSDIFDDQAIAQIRANWSDKYEKKSVLAKYQLALYFARKSPFDENADPFKVAHEVTTLRNALTHYKAQWHDEADDAKNTHRGVIPARVKHFKSPDHQDVFPDAYLNHATVEWAVQATQAFHEAFCDRAGIVRGSTRNLKLATQ